ncbi:MAG: hypothetical protein IIC73_04620 [Armatimonadetes bacterium]|nr:hypothetical protein [Armatimonadota bacterium]
MERPRNEDSSQSVKTLPSLCLAFIVMGVLPAMLSAGCKGDSTERVTQVRTTSPQGEQFLTGWTQQMVAFETVSAEILSAPMPEIDRSLPKEELVEIGVRLTRTDAAKYGLVIEGLEALDPPEDDSGLQRLKELSLRVLQLIQEDLLDIAAQAESGETPRPDEAFQQNLYDAFEEMVTIADEYGADTDVLLNRIEGLDLDHDD